MNRSEARPQILKRISMSIVLVSDLERSIAFYGDCLGLSLMTRTSEWAEFDAGSIHLALQAGGDPAAVRVDNAAGKLSISFEVEDIVGAHEALVARGVEFTRPPAEQDFGMLAVLRDPDGLEILLFERR
ncbi:MAG: VOC family protein [Candidatus Eiseniibacteriota bacterium]|jgi:lactoylglutathione lyase